jgi:YD repeat-containing protein
MDRYDTRIEDDTLFVETGEEDLEIGSMSVIVDLLGETYTLEYDEEVKVVGWLDTDEDATITFDVRETIADLDFDDRFVRRMAKESLDRETPGGIPERTAAFAELMREIWDSKGTFEFD